ncbi:perforin-1-like [Erpetoichthys calabaricus]|uniref:Perforin 1 n=1 Tax=Erpetoichthys calabaricus TaxID=27687 RepID=A0A8C4SKI2_ERPCA|nr:perforin-1-like [Erpetoichthys calabaricus]
MAVPGSGGSILLAWVSIFLCCINHLDGCTTGTPNECKEADFVPGYNLAGEGFDVVKMQRKGSYVINTNDWKKKDRTCTICKNSLMDNAMQKLPLSMIDWRVAPLCNNKLSSTVYQSSESLVSSSTSSIENNWKVELNIKVKPELEGRLMIGGTQSKLSEYTMEKSKSDKYAFTSHEVSCRYYSYRVVAEPKLHPEFQRTLKKLPKVFDENSKKAYEKVIETFGTHYIKQVQLGGKVRSVTSIQTCKAALKGLNVDDVKDCLDAEASATVGDKANMRSEVHHCKESKKKDESQQSFHNTFNDRETQVFGGKFSSPDLLFSASTEPSAYQEWLESLRTQPDVISYSLEPLSSLVRFKGPLKENLRQAVSHYVLENALLKNCSSACAVGSRSPARDSCNCVCHSNNMVNCMCCPTQKGLAKITVTVKRATGLWGDYHSQTDAFVKVFLDQRVETTNVIMETNDPRWNRQFDMGYVSLAMVGQLKFEVWDEDNKWDDDLLGSCTVPLEQGPKESLCTLNHGSLYYSYKVECGPSLGGGKCADYIASPMQTNLKNIFVSRNAVRVPQKVLLSMGVGFVSAAANASNSVSGTEDH